jgi:hypothetical protein
MPDLIFRREIAIHTDGSNFDHQCQVGDRTHQSQNQLKMGVFP